MNALYAPSPFYDITSRASQPLPLLVFSSCWYLGVTLDVTEFRTDENAHFQVCANFIKMEDVLSSEDFGRRIICDGEYGTVCYVGTIPPTSGLWLGIEWDHPLRGKHNGSHEGRRYFTCRHPTGGSFIRPKKANFGVCFLTALIKRYGRNDEWNEKMVVGKKHVELVGFESIQEEQSENRFYPPSHPSLLANAFENLTTLSLNQTGITWKEVLQCAAMWPVLEALHLASNGISSMERPVNCLQSLTLLNISDNKLSDEKQLYALSELPRLKQLIITNNRISSVEFPVTRFGCSTEFFSSLTSLSVDGNNVSLWSFINELNKLKRLQSLNCQNNPLMESEKNPGTVRQLIIAKIANLKYLNKTEILPEERRGAELDYRKFFGIDWLKAGGSHKSEFNNLCVMFLVEHPRYTALVKKYGAPDDEEIKSLQPVNLKNKLLCLTIKCPDKPDQQPIKKNLPDSMSVQKLKGLLFRLLKVPGSELKLTYESSKMEGKEIELENDLKPLQFYSVENGDCVLVRW
ncbi:tubulin-specific chaperone E isoform X5 [Rana temporaria]|uniref:tubulin-specific chaperone E isoform X5 n=1 Tax=Rana temporaria TaxID=8407 RepID=UPI001AAD6D65|nr:tubulin-specific chaperone E isoform X5 [Rana temporaria]